MKKIIVIGCGFAGLACVRNLRAARKSIELAVIDKNEYFNFLPLLPDAIGRGISLEFMAYPVKKLSGRYGFDFIHGEVKGVDPGNKRVITDSGIFPFDYLIIASGSQTNFYGNDKIRDASFKVDDAQDVKRILGRLKEGGADTCVIAGGGYTGIELAANLREYARKRKLNKRIIVVERAASILGPLPEWMKEYVSRNLKVLGIEVFPNSVIERVENNTVYLADGRTFPGAILIWAAGVKASDFAQRLALEKNPQGRLKAGAQLSIHPGCFAVGDAACFMHENNCLRMGVQFAVAQAECVSKNIVRLLSGGQPASYKPFDFGYIIPMANNASCGIVLGRRVKGIIGIILHYLMCIFRACGFRSKLGVLRGIIYGR